MFTNKKQILFNGVCVSQLVMMLVIALLLYFQCLSNLKISKKLQTAKLQKLFVFIHFFHKISQILFAADLNRGILFTICGCSRKICVLNYFRKIIWLQLKIRATTKKFPNCSNCSKYQQYFFHQYFHNGL